MYYFLDAHGVQSSLVRASCKTTFIEEDIIQEIVFQPHSSQSTLEACYELFQLDADAVNHVDVDYRDNGLVFKLRYSKDSGINFFLPDAYTYKKGEVYFSSAQTCLNEFGYYYTCLFMLGSYARYYPDKWIRDIEEASALNLAAERLVSGFEPRVPMLALSEMRREYLVRG